VLASIERIRWVNTSPAPGEAVAAARSASEAAVSKPDDVTDG